MGLGRYKVLGTPYHVVPLLKKDIILYKETKKINKKTGPRVNKCVMVVAFLREKGNAYFSLVRIYEIFTGRETFS